MRLLAASDTADYQVALPVFEGPLDLLLHLIERQELDITEVSLAQVTNQYLDYLARISERDAQDLADFLVVAAKLLLIKSRMLLPQPPAPTPPEEEVVGDDLVRQLIEYKRFKDIARWLKQVEEYGQQAYVRIQGPPPVEPVVDLGDVTLEDLLAAVREALDVKPPLPSVNGAVAPITITISDQMALIERRTAHSRRVRFRQLLENTGSRVEIIVTLLALLEMIKQLRVCVRQDRLFDEIYIERREPPASGPASPS
jgi:segregation and condensation protein A